MVQEWQLQTYCLWCKFFWNINFQLICFNCLYEAYNLIDIWSNYVFRDLTNNIWGEVRTQVTWLLCCMRTHKIPFQKSMLEQVNTWHGLQRWCFLPIFMSTEEKQFNLINGEFLTWQSLESVTTLMSHQIIIIIHKEISYNTIPLQ